MEREIVITGMGAVTPVGIGVAEFWNGLLAGRCGIGPVTSFDTSALQVHAAAQVADFDAAALLPGRLATDLDRFMQFAYVAANEALAMSGLVPDDRCGIVMGTALAGLTCIGQTQEAASLAHKPVGPRFMTKIMGNIAAAQFAIDHKITGPSLTVSTACSSGGDAITTAALLLQSGAADAIVCMGGESTVNPLFFQSLGRAGALSRSGRSAPFDASRDGFVTGEGGGALILETRARAEARGAESLARLLGWGNNTDAFHVVSPHPEGAGAAACMRLALQQAGLAPTDIGYVNAHGTATIKGDLAETKAIAQVFGSYTVPVSSTKGATGHMMGAGGITECIACIQAIRTGVLPPTLHFTAQDEASQPLSIVGPTPLQREINAAMSNALGFGGQNSSIIVGRYT